MEEKRRKITLNSLCECEITIFNCIFSILFQNVQFWFGKKSSNVPPLSKFYHALFLRDHKYGIEDNKLLGE